MRIASRPLELVTMTASGLMSSLDDKRVVGGTASNIRDSVTDPVHLKTVVVVEPLRVGDGTEMPSDRGERR